MRIQIEKMWTGNVIFEYEHKHNSMKRTVEVAVKEGISLARANLAGADLDRAYLCEADLRESNLSAARLIGADFYRADLSKANLDWADLCRAKLMGANLCEASLIGTNLYGAVLEKANLYKANLNRANLAETSLYETKGIPKIYRNDLSIIKHQDCILKAYKYLNGKKSPYKNYEYEVGKEYTFDDIDKDETVLCGAGGNVATLEWCLRDANCDLHKTYIEVEFHSKDAVIPLFSDGKFRVRKFKVLRKLSKKELKTYLE